MPKNAPTSPLEQLSTLLRFIRIDAETALEAIERRDPDMLLTVASRLGGVLWSAKQVKKLVPKEHRHLIAR